MIARDFFVRHPLLGYCRACGFRVRPGPSRVEQPEVEPDVAARSLPWPSRPGSSTASLPVLR